MTQNEKVLSLDLKNLSQEDLDWLHELQTIAQRTYIAEFYKKHGIKIKKSEGQ